jgi:mono/diheme cytochrome c family protein
MNQTGFKSLLLAVLPALVGVTLSINFASFDADDSSAWNKKTPVSTVLEGLGAKKRLHSISSLDSTLVKKGRELIKTGTTKKPNGQKTKRISKFYNCTDCHNVQRENPDLSDIGPASRLDYAIKHDLPFNQGTTLYGVVNRESWYNGDYVEKYGNAALKARDTLRNAIQLCATECAQGRKLSQWEMKAVLNYLWSIELKLGDLDPSPKLMAELQEKRKAKAKATGTIKKLKAQYYTASPATFMDALPVSEREMGEGGNPKKGKAIYKLSCRTCHKATGPSRYTLDYSVLTFNQLQRHFDDYSKKSIYQVLRYGTSPKKGYRPYMPHYPKERMSRKQVNDLAAYIRQQASADFP